MKKYLSIAAALIVMVGVVATTGTAGTSSEEPCEPQDAWTETSGWMLESPGAGWNQVEEKTVVVDEAYDETIAGASVQWWNFSPNDSKATFVGPPAFPTDSRGTWQGPHTEGGPQQDVFGTFPNGNADKGGNWFHRDPGTPDTVIHHDAVTQQEFRFAFNHPAVDCPGDELVETSASVEPLQSTCENAGEIGLLLGNKDAVDYSIEGDIAPGSTVSVTASAKAGFKLIGDDEWEITFDSFNPSSCEEDPDDPTDPTDPTDPADPGSGENPAVTSGGSGSSSSSGPQVKAATASGSTASTLTNAPAVTPTTSATQSSGTELPFSL